MRSSALPVCVDYRVQMPRCPCVDSAKELEAESKGNARW